MRTRLWNCLPLLLLAGSMQAPVPRAPAKVEQAPAEMSPGFREELYFAALEGLYRDGVQDSVVDALLELDPASGWPVNFVYACPICMPVIDALRAYRGRPVFFGDKEGRRAFGAGLDPVWVERLTSRDASVRQAAAQALIERWVAARVSMRRLAPEELETWRNEMATGRKLGMSFLEQYRRDGLWALASTMKKCPSCEAANGACERFR